MCDGAACSPPIDADEQEQPDDINEMPIPGCCLETKMMILFEVIFIRPIKTDDQEYCSDNDMETMEAGRHIENSRIDPAFSCHPFFECKGEGSMGIFITLYTRKHEAKEYRQAETLQYMILITFEQRMMRPGQRNTRS